MNNSEFNRLLKRLKSAMDKYNGLLSKAEDEYFRRYGRYPGDWDDDLWIDAFHQGEGDGLSVKEVSENAEKLKFQNDI